MLMPKLFGESFVDDFFHMPAHMGIGFNTASQNFMNTDIKETGHGYEISMNLPEFKKEEIKAELKNGYLTIHASTNTSNDQKDDNGTYIRRERFSGSCSRSFYVGDGVTQDDIKARFENGVLKLCIPKPDEKPAIENAHHISIEG